MICNQMDVLVTIAVCYADRCTPRKQFDGFVAHHLPGCNGEIKTQVFYVAFILFYLQKRLVQLRIQSMKLVKVILAAEKLADKKWSEGNVNL